LVLYLTGDSSWGSLEADSLDLNTCNFQSAKIGTLENGFCQVSNQKHFRDQNGKNI